MDRKYISTNIALAKEPHDKLKAVRALLTERLGFEPSMAQTIAHLCDHYQRTLPFIDKKKAV